MIDMALGAPMTRVNMEKHVGELKPQFVTLQSILEDQTVLGVI